MAVIVEAPAGGVVKERVAAGGSVKRSGTPLARKSDSQDEKTIQGAETEKALISEAEKPQVVYSTRLGDPFHIAELATKFGLGQKHMTYIVSLSLTLIILIAGILVGLPIRILNATFWGPPAPADTHRRLLQGIWDFACKDCIGVTASPAFLGIILIAFYFVACTPSIFLDLADLTVTRKFKIQPKAMPTAKDMLKCIALQISNLATTAFPGIVFQLIAQGPWPYGGPAFCLWACTGSELFPEEAPSVAEFLFHNLACVIIFDASYGMWHMLHHKSMLLYRHVHSLHHTYYMPFSFVTQYASLVELAPVSIYTMSIPMAMGAHPLTQWAWCFVNIQLSVEAHTGYDFPWMLGNWLFGGKALLGLGGPKSHDRHHQQPRTNFFPFLSWGDRYFGTTWQPPTKTGN